jgi:hypothetical protein
MRKSDGSFIQFLGLIRSRPHTPVILLEYSVAPSLVVVTLPRLHSLRWGNHCFNEEIKLFSYAENMFEIKKFGSYRNAVNTAHTYNIYEENMFAASLTENMHVYMLREQ